MVGVNYTPCMPMRLIWKSRKKENEKRDRFSSCDDGKHKVIHQILHLRFRIRMKERRREGGKRRKGKMKEGKGGRKGKWACVLYRNINGNPTLLITSFHWGPSPPGMCSWTLPEVEGVQLHPGPIGSERQTVQSWSKVGKVAKLPLFFSLESIPHTCHQYPLINSLCTLLDLDIFIFIRARVFSLNILFLAKDISLEATPWPHILVCFILVSFFVIHKKLQFLLEVLSREGTEAVSQGK